MATERFIHGKTDNAAHCGRYSNVLREQAAEYHEKHWTELINVNLLQEGEMRELCDPLLKNDGGGVSPSLEK